MSQYEHGSTSNIVRVSLKHSTTGQGLTGLDNSSAGLIISTITDNESAVTVYTVAAGNVETITTIGTYAAPTASKCRFKAVDGTNHPGVYEIQLADARFAVVGAERLYISVTGAANLLGTDKEIELVDFATVAEIQDGLFDETVEGSTTVRQMFRGFASALLSKASGLGTATAVFRDIGDTKNRITATVDADGNRSAITLDLT